MSSTDQVEQAGNLLHDALSELQHATGPEQEQKAGFKALAAVSALAVGFFHNVALIAESLERRG